ncbi:MULTISPECIES: M14 family zinc carboxypeptidase [Flavobacteriaceae]|uniref:M14 family zinc carboxypeptidase n=1 Tax=Flavobacteriaceae TaxID=49546 RepID=UPI0014917FA8|nr:MULTISPECIES: M14 family zinc carboxypeptidase [Allomuricauda]MDC6364658.1 M14 family zinc carboxypeptidase [Muricauda sp. AC10]
MLHKFLLCCFALTAFTIHAQEDFTSNLYETYAKYKESSLNKRRIKHHQIQPLIQKIKENPKFEVQKVGESIEGRDLHLISIGTGETDVFLWSQMHGDEPTATMATFDILHFLDSPDFKAEKEEMLSKLKLHFLPMLNPDGAEVYQRRNALGIDINRDALRLQSPEGRVLKRIRDSLDADFGFNLHDQSTYYNAELTDKPATISYLATAYNYEKDINEVRSNAMKVIVYMNSIIQNYAPGQVGRYSDDFEPRAFGDNIAKWGTSLILIESGGYANDVEKQEIRKLNYVSILSALYTIAKGTYKDIPIDDYEKIPRNDRKLFDLKIENVTYELLGNDYILDLGIQRQEIDLEDHDHFYIKSVIVDQGDLSTYYGYETFDASGYKIVPPKMYPRPINTNSRAFWNPEGSPFKSGYGYFKSDFLPPIPFTELPGHFVSESSKIPNFSLKPGVNPTFFLEKDGVLTHAVINGFLLDLSKTLEEQKFGNALIYR